MASKQLVIEIISDAKKFTSGLTEAINTISKATEKAEGFEKYTEQLEAMKKELLEVTQQTAQIEKNVRTGGEIVSQEQLNRIDALTSKVESIDKRFDSFRHTFGDMQDKLNGLSTRTLQVQLDKVNASLDAFREKYSSLQQTLNIGLGNNKSIEQMSNIGELKAAYEDALKVFNNFTKETKFDGEKYSKSYIEAAKAVYEYSSALWDLNDTYQNTHNKAFYSEEVMNPIDDMMSITSEILGADLSNKLYDSLQNSIDKINISNFFKNVEGQINGQNLSGAMKNGGIIVPVKLDPKSFSVLESEIKKDISALQSRANANPIKVHYETNTDELSKNIEKYFKELNTKLKNQVTELNTLMKGLVDDTGLKNTEQDFSSMAKLIPEMLRKIAEYSEQLKTITTDTKNSFENINSFIKEDNFINYANAIKETADSFKLLTSSLEDVSSKLSGNGLEGQFDILKKKFADISIDTLLNKEDGEEYKKARQAKIKEIKELFALYSTYQSRGGIRPFSDLVSGETNANKKAYLQSAYNEYAKGKSKKEISDGTAPFDAKQLENILKILKDIKQTIKNISEIKIDTSDLTKVITEIQGGVSEKILTPQMASEIWRTAIQYAETYSESLGKIIENLETISQKDFSSIKFDSENFEELQKTYSQIENIVHLLEKGFNIPSNDQLNAQFDHIKTVYDSLTNDKGALDLRKKKEEIKEVYELYQQYQKLGGEKDISFLTDNKKDQKKITSGYKQYIDELLVNEQKIQEETIENNEAIEKVKLTAVEAILNIETILRTLETDLNNLAENIIAIGTSTNQIDYSNKISNIRGGITILNKSIQELVNLTHQINFEKINNIEISTEPFDKVVESLKEIIDLTERISGVPSKSNLDSQFKDIQKIYSSLVNDKGNFIVTKDKEAVKDLFSQYEKYIKYGGTKSLVDLDSSKANINKLSKYYNKYLEGVSQKDESNISVTNSLKNEARGFIGIKDAAAEAATAKESFIKENKKLETQTNKTTKSLEQEKKQLETFINDVKTLVNTEIKTNNVVDFNTKILDSSKNTNEALKEELQYLKQINEFQKTTLIKQGNRDNNSTFHTTSSKKQNINEQVNLFQNSNNELNHEDLGLNYDPYLNAFQEFLLLAAEEAEKVKQQIISVADFDQELSDILTNLYAEIPDLEDISASTGYGKNFNVTGATVSYRDKTTNDIYKKSFSLRQDKDSGEFYIDQTTAILNNAEKYGKDNEKQAQKVLEWQTKLNAWLQSFSNKTSGTLDSTTDFQSLKNYNFLSEKDWINIKTIQQRLEGLYNEIVSNSRKGTSSLSPVPNMMFGQESRLTKMQKANSIYNKMAVDWNGERGAEDTESELKKLSSLYNNLHIEIAKFNEDGSNIESVARAYGAFNEQLNTVNEQLNRMKIVNTEINGNKINSLNNWFKDIPDPNSVEDKIEKYGQIYNQFAEAQQQLNELTTNLNKGTTEEDAQNYEAKKEKIHELVLELEKLKKILSSDSMNINNQMGQVIKQNLSETVNIEELEKIIDEYAEAKGKITESSRTGIITDKDGNEFIKFSKIIQDTKGKVSEFEFTYDKAMNTVAVATKKVQEPESIFKTLADELSTKWRGLFTTLASFIGFYQLWGYFKQGIGIVREFDTALTEMQKVSNETISTLQDYQKTTFDTADAIGATALQIQNSTADFMRLGESLNKAAESAKAANVLMNVSEFGSIDEATKSLIAMSAAYDDLSKMNIIDKLNEVGLKIA